MQQQNNMQMMDAPPPPPAITFGNLAERARRGLNFKVVGFMPSNAKFEDIHKDDILFDLIQTEAGSAEVRGATAVESMAAHYRD
jgi:hypothetical protein